MRPLCFNRKYHKMAVRRELVIDECGGATRRRKQAHAFNLPKTTNLKELNRRKDSDKTRGGGQGVLR